MHDQADLSPAMLAVIFRQAATSAQFPLALLKLLLRHPFMVTTSDPGR